MVSGQRAAPGGAARCPEAGIRFWGHRGERVGCSMPAQLVSLTDGPTLIVDKPVLLIGRHPECDIQIDSRKISRRHCCIAQVADYLVVRDLGSTNGIRINGVRVLEGRLNHDDELTIGGLRYRVCWGQPAESAPRPAPDVAIRAEPQHPAPPIEVDDDAVLEACDEPVPLVDPHGPRPEGDSNHHRPHVLPNELHLAPASESDGQSPSSK
ncbi:MAG TPA: FHA domain-containing protein [Gemmataceae bacterium]|nr:FHA domain-containing protein [Gemmataceae bacterium]